MATQSNTPEPGDATHREPEAPQLQRTESRMSMKDPPQQDDMDIDLPKLTTGSNEALGHIEAMATQPNTPEPGDATHHEPEAPKLQRTASRMSMKDPPQQDDMDIDLPKLTTGSNEALGHIEAMATQPNTPEPGDATHHEPEAPKLQRTASRMSMKDPPQQDDMDIDLPKLTTGSNEALGHIEAMATQPNTPEPGDATHHEPEAPKLQRTASRMSMKDPPQQDDRDPCGKLWEVYVNEARRYDEALLKSWKEDMDVILVFSGLYSAVLTAFVIESYQKLQEDPADVSATLLKHISDQLASLSANQMVSQSTSETFTPSSSALACNVLWFFSLVLALMCAFLATFVQQWARQFLHRSSIAHSPTAQARLLSFLYYGIRNYGMHTIVDIIPSFLHLSLFAFLAGLVAFLNDVHPALTWLIGVSLAMATAIYSTFTLLPIFTLNSPYRTPISPVVWKAWQILRVTAVPPLLPVWTRIAKTVVRGHKAFKFTIHTTLSRLAPLLNRSQVSKTNVLPVSFPVQRKAGLTSRHSHTDTLVGAMKRASQTNYQGREAKSILWTISMLNDDTELLPFIEALLDVIRPGNHSPIRDQEIHLLRPILETSNPNHDIIAKTLMVMKNAQNPWITDEYRKRCLPACLKLLWALAYTLTHRHDKFSLEETGRLSWFRLQQLEDLLEPESDYYSIGSAVLALCGLNTWICAEACIKAGASEISLQQWFDFSLKCDHDREETVQTNLERRKCEQLKWYLLRCVEDSSSGYYFNATISAFQGIRGSPHFDPWTVINHLERKLATVDAKNKTKLHEMDQVFGTCLDFAVIIWGSSWVRYISERTSQSGWQATLSIWTTVHRMFSFSQELLDYPFFHQDQHAVIALREAWFSTQPEFQAGDDQIDIGGVMLSVLRELSSDPEKSASSIAHHCLQAMTSSRLVWDAWTKSSRRTHLSSVAPQSPCGDLLQYLRTQSGRPKWLMETTQVEDHNIRSFTRLLLTQVLSYPLLTPGVALEIRNAVAFIYVDLIQIAVNFFDESRSKFDAAEELARTTRTWCEFFQKNPTQEVVDVLMVIWEVWRRWEPNDDETLVPVLEILVGSMNTVKSTTSKMDLHNMHTTGRSTKGNDLYDISDLYKERDLISCIDLFHSQLNRRCPSIVVKYLPDLLPPLPIADNEGL